MSIKFDNGTVFVHGIAETRLFFIVDFDLRTGRAEMRTRSFFFLSQNWRFFVAKLAILQTRTCKILQNYAKNSKNLQNICIYQKKVVILHQISEENRNEPQKVNQ